MASIRTNEPTLRIVFDRRKKATKTREESVLFEIMHRRVRRYLNSGIRLCLHQWSKERQCVVNHPSVDLLNEHLEEQRRELLDVMLAHARSKQGFDLDRYIEEVSTFKKQDKNRPSSFIDFAYHRTQERGIQSSTRRQHETALRALEESGIIKSFSDLTPANLTRFDAWLRTTKGITHQPTIYGYHKRIKVYINEAIQFDYIKDNPYNKVKTPRGDHQKLRYLTQEEVDKIRSLEITNDPSTEKVRSLFVLQIYTGLAYSDLFAVNWSEAEKREDGRYYIRQARLKTQEEYYLLLLPPAVEILERWDWKLPPLSNQKYNAYLKGLGLALGFRKKLTTHVARHTFATTITLANHVPIEIVAKMMGHSDIKTTQRYAKVLAEDVIDAFIDLEDKI